MHAHRAVPSPVQSEFEVFAARGPTDRLFFAIHPDAQAVSRIVELAHALRAQHGLRGKPLPADRMHVTLHHLGDYRGLPEQVVAAVSAAAERVRVQPFEVSFDCVASFPGHAHKRPCVLRAGLPDANPALFALHAALGERLRVHGLGRCIERHYTPHVTLLYDERTVMPEAVPPIGWSVHQFTLVHSLLGRGEHRVLARWDLGP